MFFYEQIVAEIRYICLTVFMLSFKRYLINDRKYYILDIVGAEIHSDHEAAEIRGCGGRYAILQTVTFLQ